MKRVLVVYYSQTGQSTKIVHSVLTQLKQSEDIELIFEEIRPKNKYPFPWGGMNFFDAMPESVKEIPCELEPFQFNPGDPFDLIVLAYQPWYLSPSIPVSSFLQSGEGKQVMKGKPVITVIGCRNMWLNAQEKVKKRILEAGGNLVGNIVLTDKGKNLVSLVTVIGWLIYGKKSGFLNIFPTSGVAEDDIQEARRFGNTIQTALLSGNWDDLQQQLNEQKAVEVVPNLMVLENRGARLFKLYANFIGSQGPPGHPKRRLRVRMLLVLLPLGVVVLSPITTLVSFVKIKLSKDKIARQVSSYYGNSIVDSRNK